jgi:sugar phosphate isomerase/epimerase
MNRRNFLAGAVAAAAGSGGLRGALGEGLDRAHPADANLQSAANSSASGAIPRHDGVKRPRAITMWEFSWIERRWPGAGFEDWDQALDELRERGYDAVRIDPFPHLLATDPKKTWTLEPEWTTQDWGSPDVNRIVLMPALTEFLSKCKARGVKVGLSTWYRKDQDDTRMKITGPEVQAAQWIQTLDTIRETGLLDTILYTDLCNEWPGDDWAPFVKPHMSYGDWAKPESLSWMHTAIGLVREHYPELPLFFSVAGEPNANQAPQLADFDLLDLHVWMTQQNDGEFYKLTGYSYEHFDPKGYTNLSLKAEETYRARPQYWQQLLTDKIDRLAAASRATKMPLITTECWAIVDYKDWPLLKWDWVKELCALGAARAVASGQWLAIATSNFCEPQFVGMWRDVAWHQRMTGVIKNGEIHAELRRGRFYERL